MQVNKAAIAATDNLAIVGLMSSDPADEVVLSNRKLLISRAPTKAKSREPAYSQALNQNKIIT